MSSTSAQLAARLLTLSLVFGFYAATTSPSQQSQEPQERKTVTVDARVYDAYVGQYELAPKTLLTLRREKHHFMAQITGQPPFEIFPESETKFFWKVVEAQFVIEKDKDGKVEGLLFEQGAVKLKAKKISNELPKEVELPEPVDVIESRG
jgi:hypothetical protein